MFVAGVGKAPVEEAFELTFAFAFALAFAVVKDFLGILEYFDDETEALVAEPSDTIGLVSLPVALEILSFSTPAMSPGNNINNLLANSNSPAPEMRLTNSKMVFEIGSTSGPDNTDPNFA